MSKASSSAASKKRDKPKRPLSAYNLFYRFKRAKILEAHLKDGDDSKEAIRRLVAAATGLEGYPAVALATMPLERRNEISRNAIRSALLRNDNLSPKDTRNRTHRKKAHGPALLSFLEMNGIMVAAWKAVDDVARGVFEELAEEGRRMYQKRIAEYEEKHPPSRSPPKKRLKATGSTVAVRTLKKIQDEKIQAKTIHSADTANKEMEAANDTRLTPEKKAQLKILHFGKPLSNPKKKKASRGKRKTGVVAKPPPPTRSDNPAASHLDSIDLDLESGPEPPQSLADMFGLEDSSCSSAGEDNEISAPMMRPPHSSPTGVFCELDDFPNLPFSPVEEEEQQGWLHDKSLLLSPNMPHYGIDTATSVDDFLELIATLV